MNAIEALWDLVLVNSARATLLIACVFLLRFVFQGRIPARFFPWLWLLVAARLLLPVAPSSSTSIYNLSFTGSPLAEESPRWKVRTEPALNPPSEPVEDTVALVDPAPQSVSSTRWSLLPCVWLGGVFLQAAMLGWSAYRMRRELKAATPVDDPRVVAVLARCAATLRLRGRIALFETDAVSGPAVMGLWRPRLLLPRGLANELSGQELEYVLLHECAHLRRHDLIAVWLLLAARILHWFNPFVWLAVRSARVDSEFACDETVLRHCSSEEDAPRSYGGALLRLAQLIPWRPSRHPVAGMFERRTTLCARVATISRYSPVAPWRTVAAALLTLSVAIVFGADETKAPLPSEIAATQPPGDLQDWTKGLSVIRIKLPELENAAPGEVELQATDGRRFVPNVGAPLTDDPWVESLTPESDGSGWNVTLRKGSESAVIRIPDEVIARAERYSQAKVQVEFESRFFETTDTAILRLQSRAPGVELLRTAVRRGPDQAILSKAQTEDLLTGVQWKNDTNLLSTPRVTTKSGQRAVIEIIREFRYPSEFKRDPEDKMWIPLTFVTRNTGVTVELEPTVGKDGRIRVHIIAQAVELLGSRDETSGKGFPLDGPPRRGLDPMRPTGTFLILDPANLRTLLKPVFSTRKREATVTLNPGESLLFTSMPETEDVAPLESPAKTRRLVSMITARLVNPTGEPAVVAPTATGDANAKPGVANGEAPAALSDSALPTAIVRAGDKPGFVRSPHAPESGVIDVRGFPPGTEVKCPYSGKLILVP